MQATCLGAYAWSIAICALSASVSCAVLQQDSSRSIIARTEGPGIARASNEASSSILTENAANVTSRNFAVSPHSHINVTSHTTTLQQLQPQVSVQLRHTPAVRSKRVHLSDPTAAPAWHTQDSLLGLPRSPRSSSSSSSWGQLTQQHAAQHQLTENQLAQQQMARRQLLQADSEASPYAMSDTQPTGADPSIAEELNGSNSDGSIDTGSRASQEDAAQAGKRTVTKV